MPASFYLVASRVPLPLGTIFNPLIISLSPSIHHVAIPYNGSKRPSQTARRSLFFNEETMDDKS